MVGGICERQSVDRFLLEGRRHIGRAAARMYENSYNVT